MRFLRSIIVALPGITFLVAAAPAVSGEPQYPDGFPNPNPEQLKRIEHQARGMLPNGPLPSKISQEGILSLKWIAFNEIFEAAYFTELLRNVTNNVPGYRIEDKRDHNHAVRSLTAIRAVWPPPRSIDEI